MDKEEIIGRNSVEDASWLCHLSESELDLLIDLKKMVIHRAKLINCASLGEKFDLKILRALGFILMEHCKENIKNMSDTPVLADFCASLDKCNLLKQDDKDGSGSMSMEELKVFFRNRKRRAAELYDEEVCQEPGGQPMEDD
ncbi:Spc97 / Spc98 family of spindle pole body component [Heracleum sosnowskyi]|uniref:Spc97 / Spc98 family of spindle pole body component n=1 Tax=Heracleum sosnowskyi TaxID=360622 RepID=A0AAD8MPQ1_9APIA|nr:Spc97 / Spc98 family of spindle pole body component [Heracleum sosnowskyi]